MEAAGVMMASIVSTVTFVSPEAESGVHVETLSTV
jgi:hypothetical protein